MRLSTEKLKLQKKGIKLGVGGMEILGLKASIIKIKNSWNGLNNRSEMAEENSP